MIQGGYKNSAVMQKFDIAERTVLKLKKDGPQIIKDAERNSLTLNTKSVRPAKFPAVDDEVLRFIDLARSAKTPITLDAIMKRALLVKAEILQHSTLSEVERVRLEAFTASKGWVLNFIRRHGLRSVALRGSDASANVVAEKNDLAEVQKRLNDYELRHIFNVDETSLFFKVLPRHSYVLDSEGRKTLVGSRHMDVADKITAYLCCNADGSERAPVAVIGKSKNPKCFKTGRLPEGMEYYSNKTAKANGPTLRSWFNGVFLPFVRSRTDQKVALLVDYVSLHGDLKDGRGQVEVIPLPPNITTIHQPMDMGIKQKWKREYRLRMLAAITSDVVSRQKRRLLNEANPLGTNGIAEGFEPHLLDVMRLGKDAWDFLPQIVLAKAWEKAGILPQGKITPGLPHVVEENEASKVAIIVCGLKGAMKEDDPLFKDFMSEVDEEVVRTWFNVEEDVEIRNAIKEDALEQMKRPAPKIEVKPETSDEEVVKPLPSLQMLYDAFRPAQDLAMQYNLTEATHCLKLAIECARDAINKANCTREGDDMKMEGKRLTPRKRTKKELSPMSGISKSITERERNEVMVVPSPAVGVKVEVPRLPTTMATSANTVLVPTQGGTASVSGTPQLNTSQLTVLKDIAPHGGAHMTSNVMAKQTNMDLVEQQQSDVFKPEKTEVGVTISVNANLKDETTSQLKTVGEMTNVQVDGVMGNNTKTTWPVANSVVHNPVPMNVSSGSTSNGNSSVVERKGT